MARVALPGALVLTTRGRVPSHPGLLLRKQGRLAGKRLGIWARAVWPQSSWPSPGPGPVCLPAEAWTLGFVLGQTMRAGWGAGSLWRHHFRPSELGPWHLRADGPADPASVEATW